MTKQINGDKLFVINPHPAIPSSDQLKKWEDKWFDEEEHPDVLLIQAFQAGAVAALKAAADQVVPEEPLYGGDQRWMFERDARQACRKKFLAIAAELESANTDFRALCQELIDEIDAKAYGIKSLPSSVAIDRARAALARWGRPAIEPVP
jgi:hypothetical protein